MMGILQFLVGCLLLYLFIGLILAFVWFAYAKIVEFDTKNEQWNLVLNSVIGLTLFLVTVTMLWLPVALPFLKKKGHLLKMKRQTHVVENPESRALKLFSKPMRALKSRLDDWYYYQ
ncbi:hypothetical protein OM416_20205 [Paenibacillus sp. LS1]|nr:hypothetical protein [Paenibacillus sp. LS1]